MTMTSEERREYNRQYYLETKKKRAEENGKRVKCKCGAEVSASSYTRHLKSDLHIGKLVRKLQYQNLKNIAEKLK